MIRAHVAGVGLAALLALASCATTAPIAGAPAAAPSPLAEFPSVLSTTTADSTREASPRAIADELRARPLPLPPGHQQLAVVEDEGPGSFRVALPETFTLRWRPGEPFDQMLAAGARRDSQWTDGAIENIIGEPPGGNLRIVVLDLSRDDELATFHASVERAPDETGDALAARGRADFAERGYTVDAARGVVVNGANGAYLEFSDQKEVYVQVRVLDPPFAAMWALTCYGPVARRADVRETCATAAATFEPLPVVVP